MASVALSAGDLVSIRRMETHPTVWTARNWTAMGWLRMVPEIAASFLFLGILGWEVWRIGGCLLQLGILMAAGATSSAIADPAVNSMWPPSGVWPW